MSSCCATSPGGPGFATPLAAFTSGTREKLAYLPVTTADQTAPDYVATVDLDEASPTFSTVIHRLPLGVGDELHHSGWNACSSCHGDPAASRRHLILPSVRSSTIYAVDVATDPRAPRLALKLDGKDFKAATGRSILHTSHCLGDGTIMVSTMGKEDGTSAAGSFVILDQELNVKKRWSKDDTPYGYDYWYQPALDVMISTGWGAPGAFLAGFNPAEAATRYSSAIHVWSWSTQSLVQTLELGDAGRIPLEVRFLHEPTAATAYVGAALSSNLLRVSPAGGAAADGGNKGGGQWAAEVAFAQPWTPVTGWALPEMPPLITDLLISLDDRWLILSNWLRGDLVLLDISDRAAPRLASRLWLGGSIVKGEGVVVTGGEFAGDAQPARPAVKGVPLQGGPQMIQLSLDGRRLYVTNSLFSSWDRQFYPELARRGSQLVRVLVDGDAGTLALDPTFLVDFGAEPGGAALAHEIRFPEGDCTSDIWLKA